MSIRDRFRTCLRPLAALTAAAAVCGAAAAVSATPSEAASAAKKKPNFVVIMTDDQAMNTFNRKVMPKTFRALVDKGTAFSDSIAVPPLCCPARAGFQTGQYPHNHGVLVNDYNLLVDKDNIISTWLQRAGYRTGFVGKYMNEYPGGKPAPGYTTWKQIVGKPDYWNFLWSDNGRVRRMKKKRRNYSTTLITNETKKFIRNSARAGKPFFVWASYYAPHNRRAKELKRCKLGATPLIKDWRRWRNARIDLRRNYNEWDVHDKPSQISDLQPLRSRERKAVMDRARCAAASLAEVDRGVAQIRNTLKKAGVLNNTGIFFLSDNGYFFGEHRKPKGKGIPYEEAVRVPWAVRIPEPVLGAKPVKRVDETVSNIDLAPTMLDLAGAAPCDAESCRALDGYSLTRVLRGQQPEWRQPRRMLLEIGVGCESYRAVRYGNEVIYTEWYWRGNDYHAKKSYGLKHAPLGCELVSREMYDLRRDPFQMDNLLWGWRAEHAANKVLAEMLDNELDALRNCSGHSGPQPCY